jgi:hypothetical protein
MNSAFDTAEPVPRRGHFVWFGREFPYMNTVAVKSALLRSGIRELWLWHADPLAGQRHFDELCEDPRVSSRPLSAETLFADAGDAPFDVAVLSRMYGLVRSPVTRSNIARAAALYLHGGIYFDIDTLCCKSFAPLFREPAFVGTEHIVWPHQRRFRRDLYRYLWGPLLGRLRALTASIPFGDVLYRRTRQLYFEEVNGAILGSRPGHEFLADLLRRTARVPEDQWQVPHVLGTYVLQEAVAAYQGRDLRILPPECFYPLGPVVSRHYFRRQADSRAAARRILSNETYAIHWYASISDLSALGPGDVAAMSGTTVFGRLCEELVAAAS